MKMQGVFNRIFNKEVAKNAIIWLIVYIIFTIPFGLETALALVLPLIIPVHLNYWLLDKFIKKQKYIHYSISIVVILMFFGAFAQNIGEQAMYPRIIFVPEGQFAASDYIYSVNAAFNPLIAVILTTLFRFFREKQQMQIIENEKERVKAELNMLKHQVNPHFLFNTLNNLFSMSSTYGDEATANGIGHLSHLMRYMLYDTNSEYVRLANEIDMLENFIDLQKLRLNEESKKNIEFSVSGEIVKNQIPPMLLIPFLENAFKHGYSINNEFFVKTNINIYNNVLYMNVDNSINKSRENSNLDSSGIGLENVRKRLDLLYHDEYLLEINNKDNIHTVSLKIPLKV